MKKILKWIAIVVGGVSFAMIVFSLFIVADRSPEKKAAIEAARNAAEQEIIATTPKITAQNLAQAYNDNTVAADQQFKGKSFRVSGTVADINTDVLGQPYLALRGGVNEFMEPQFSFDNADSNQLAKLKKGDRVTLICTGKGDIAKVPMSDSCKLIEA